MRTSMRIVFAIAALLVPAAAFANGYHLPNSTPRDLGLAGSATAAANSAAAVYTNPSALAGLDGLSLDGSLELITLSASMRPRNC